ncbi:NLPA lipofamily protein [Vibrio parahaemolyticus 50]|nr:NLPA lipofamily protein [Vibrio parahaemolyticus 50]
MTNLGHIKELSWVLAAALSLSACGEKDNSVIKVGATVGPHAQVVEAVAKEAAKQGLNVEVIEFSDYVTPNAALSDGSIDINSYQHQPFWITSTAVIILSSFQLANLS